jgi:hypothetical protein
MRCGKPGLLQGLGVLSWPRRAQSALWQVPGPSRSPWPGGPGRLLTRVQFANSMHMAPRSWGLIALNWFWPCVGSRRPDFRRCFWRTGAFINSLCIGRHRTRRQVGRCSISHGAPCGRRQWQVLTRRERAAAGRGANPSRRTLSPYWKPRHARGFLSFVPPAFGERRHRGLAQRLRRRACGPPGVKM